MAFWPSSGALYGAYVDLQRPPNGESQGDITTRESSLGRTLALDMHFYGQSPPSDGFPEWDLANGRTPIITTAFAWGSASFPGYSSITNGSQNSIFDSWATYLKTLNDTVIVRLFQEFNGTWYNFAAGTSGYNPGFANMWRYIWNRWNAAGVDLGGKVQICWCPNTETNINITAATTDAGYPGDAYVDVIGVDLYNKDSGGGGGGLSFQSGFSTIYGRYAGTRKPFLVPEFGCVDHALDQRKNWFNAMKAYIKGGSVPLLKGICYWDAVGTGTDPVTGQLFEYRTDQTTTGNATSATDSFNAWKSVGTDAYFNPTTTGGGTATAKTPFLGICQPQANTVPTGWGSAVEGFSSYFTWRELETLDQGGTLNGPGLARIQSIISYCQANGHTWKIRLFANGAYGGYSGGRDAGAPAWVKADSAIPKFRHMNSQDQNPYSGPALLLCGYWSARWKTLYTRFINHLGALLDGEPTLHDITISYGMMLYAEPLILDAFGSATNPANSAQTFNTGLANRHELVGGGTGYGIGDPATLNPRNIAVPGAGFTDAGHMAAMQAGMDAHTNAFPNTPQSFSFNPYQTINPDASASSESTTLTNTKKLIDYAASRGCVLENNSARPSYFTYSGSTAIGFSTGVMPSMYQYMKAKNRPIFIQTANQNQITDAKFATVKSASEATMSGVINIIEACGCEPVPTYKTVETTGIVSGWNTALIANYGQAASAPSFNGTLPGVTGTPQQGQTLIADPGNITGFPAPTITYQWQTSATGAGSWTDITGATSSSYLLPAGQVGKFLRVHVTATNASGTASANSASTAVVTGTSSAPVWTVQPFVTGTAKEGSVLTANTGTVTGTPTPTITYQWETSADGTTGSWSNIGGATSSTYTLPGGSAGSYKRCKLTATNTGGTTNAWTPKVGPVTTADASPSFSVAASVSGTTIAGHTLTLNPGTATGTPTPTLTQQWQRSPNNSTWTDIPGQASLTYMLTTADVNNYVRALVTATNGAGTATSSDSVGPVTTTTSFPDLTLQVTIE